MREKLFIAGLLSLMVAVPSFAKETKALQVQEEISKEKQLVNKIYALLEVDRISEETLLKLVKEKKITIAELYASKDNQICMLTNKFATTYDSDKDGLSDYDEIFKYKTNPNKADSDGDGIIDSDWNERKEYTYTVNYKTKIFNLYDEDSLAMAFQDGRVIKKTDEYSEIELIVYPENTYYEYLYENPNWKADYSGMKTYLEPTVLCNWDNQMREDLINELKQSGIDPDQLTDVELVKQVTAWIEKNNKRLFTNGWDIFLQVENGKVVEPKDKKIIEKMRKAFPTESFQQIRDSMILGKEMYYNKTIGECLGSSTYYATIFRALGIPTRMVAMTPMGYPRQIQLIDKVQQSSYRELLNKTLSMPGWSNHYHTQVYIGNMWVDVEYSNVGNNFANDYFAGYITFNTFNDYSQFAVLANNLWYKHMFIERNKNFSSWIPYELLEAYDLEAVHSLS